MSEPYQISITKAGDAIVCSIDMWRDVQEKIDRFFAERMEEEAVRQLREIGFERVEAIERKLNHKAAVGIRHEWREDA